MNDVSTSIGILKNSNRAGEVVPKENARASSVIRPRAVLSSPGNTTFVRKYKSILVFFTCVQKLIG